MTIAELHSLIYGTDELPDPMAYIEICNTNAEALDVTHPDVLSIEDYNKLCKIRSQYALHLVYQGYFQLAIPAINMALTLWEKHPNLPKLSLREVEYYEHLRLQRGISYFNLKKYNESLADMKDLLLTYPGNDRYKNWIVAINGRKLTRVQSIIMWVGFAFITIDILILNSSRNTGRMVMAIFLFSVFGIEAYKRLQKK